MQAETAQYNAALEDADAEICNLLANKIDRALPEAENKIWHAHPVWFAVSGVKKKDLHRWLAKGPVGAAEVDGYQSSFSAN